MVIHTRIVALLDTDLTFLRVDNREEDRGNTLDGMEEETEEIGGDGDRRVGDSDGNVEEAEYDHFVQW